MQTHDWVYHGLSLLGALIELWLSWNACRKRRPGRWSMILMSPAGPRTDTAFMTRPQLLRSARGFLLWALHSAVVLCMLLSVFAVFYFPSDPPPLLMAFAFFILPVLTIIFLASAVWLFAHWLFRRTTYEEDLELFLTAGPLNNEVPEDVA